MDPAPEQHGDPTVPLELLAARFAAVIREEGAAVSVDATITFCRALTRVGLTSDAGVYWAGRATLVTHPDDIPAYDRAFQRFWLRGPAPSQDAPAADPDEQVLSFDDPDLEGTDHETEDRPVTEVRYSPDDILRERDLGACSAEELAEAFRLIDRIELAVPHRRSRRRRSGGRGSGRLDTRRTVRRALRTSGELVDRPTTIRRVRPRRLVLLCDVSGSMEPYSRALLRFLHVVVASRYPAEAFAFSTRLTRLTRALRSPHPDVALDAAAAAIPDLSGGTRLGEILREFNDRWGVPGIARGAVVVVLSDGWDRGDPDELSAQMHRLRRVAHAIIWVNPLKAQPGYRPLARGMAAALPAVDRFVTGHSVAALEDLAELLADNLDRGRP